MKDQLPNLNLLSRTLQGALLAAFICAGAIVAVLLPPFNVPDENAHWYAALHRYEAIAARLSGRAAVCGPAFALPNHFEINRLVFREEQKLGSGKFSTLRSLEGRCPPADAAAWYGSLFTYPGVIIARLIVSGENNSGVKSYLVFLLSRFIHGLLILAAMLRLVTLVRDRDPSGGGMLLLLCFALSPLFLQQSFSVSAEPISFLAVITGLSIVVGKFRAADLLVFVLVNSVAVHSKPNLLPISLCALLLGYFLDDSRELRVKRFIVLLPFLIIAGATLLSLIAGGRPHQYQLTGRDIDVGRQLSYAASHPFEALYLNARSVWHFLNPRGLTGPLGWLDTKLPGTLINLWTALLLSTATIEAIFLFFKAKSAKKETKRNACAVFVVGALFAGAAAWGTAFIIYLTWTRVGFGSVEGIQARHILAPCLAALGVFMLANQVLSFDGRDNAPPAVPSKASSFSLGNSLLLAAISIFLAAYTANLSLTLLVRYW